MEKLDFLGTLNAKEASNRLTKIIDSLNRAKKEKNINEDVLNKIARTMLDGILLQLKYHALRKEKVEDIPEIKRLKKLLKGVPKTL